MVRRRLIDFGIGLLGAAVCASALLLQSWSETMLEYALIVLPLVIFPLITRLRTERSAPWTTFIAVNVWLVITYAGLARLVSASVRGLLPPLLIGLLASAGVSLLASKRWTAAGVIVVAAGAGALLVPATWSAILTSAVQRPAPDVTFQSLDGRPIRLADLRGSVVVLNFWGVWCGPCVQEMPELAAFTRGADARSVHVFAVNSGIGGETPDDIRRFLRLHGLTIPVVLDPGRSVYRAFGVRGLPTTIIIDPHGIACSRRVGFAATAGYGEWLAREVRRVGA